MKDFGLIFGSFAIIVGVILFVSLVVVLVPLGTIWSMNLLFGLTIPYTIYTWFATVWLTTIFGNKYQTIARKVKR